MAVADALDVEAAVDQVVRSALHSIAAAADEDQLPITSVGSVTSVLTHFIAEVAQPLPSRLRIPAIASARDLIAEFADACARESV